MDLILVFLVDHALPLHEKSGSGLIFVICKFLLQYLYFT